MKKKIHFHSLHYSHQICKIPCEMFVKNFFIIKTYMYDALKFDKNNKNNWCDLGILIERTKNLKWLNDIAKCSNLKDLISSASDIISFISFENNLELMASPIHKLKTSAIRRSNTACECHMKHTTVHISPNASGCGLF